MPLSPFERRPDGIVLGLALASIVSAFVLPLPPGFQDLDRSMWPRLAQVLATALAFILIFVGRSHPSRWRLVAVTATLGILASLFSYLYLSARFTCRYYDQPKIIGSGLMPIASDYRARYPSATCQDLLKAFTGRTEEIWSARSLWIAEVALGTTYASIVPLLAAAIAALA